MNTEEFYVYYLKCNKITIDSRKVQKNDIFFAFSGENFNAATLAETAINMGALAVIVEDKQYENQDKNIYYVPSTLEFLQNFARYHRDQLKIPIIALTGSNGKTTTKELMHAVLSAKYDVQCTFGNLNNHIGVPLTLLSIKNHHEIAVVEMGANHQGEIELLCSLAKPNYGYITNFGKAHLEGFGGFEGVIKGKSELYNYLTENNGIILINESDAIQQQKTLNYSNKITFGNQNSDYSFEEFSEENFVGISFNGIKAQSKLTGNYNFTNLCAAASLGMHFGIDFLKIKEAIQNYLPTNMRSQVISKNGKKLVLDTYNANPSSMTEALKNFSSFKGTKTIIMGDMLELGEESLKEHSSVLELAQHLSFDQIITVGKQFHETGLSQHAFVNTESLIDYLKKNSLDSDNILLKASRGIALERIIDFI